jgi:anti-sigma regulatory factor (Ser/Thr protein kinase)
MQRDEHADALGQICRLHSSVVHPPGAAPDPRGLVEIEVSACFAPRPESAGPARDFVIDALRGWGHGGALLDDAQLVVSELATNAIVHARSVFWVEARTHSSSLRLSVRDASPDVPTACQAVPLAPSGRGLDLVAALATSWGVDLTADGKTVWAEFGF